VADVLAAYRGPVAPMSFDPRQLTVLRQKAPGLPRGIIAAKYRPHPYWDLMPPWMRYGMGYLLTALTVRPQFVAYAIADLPALAPLFARHVFGMPLLTWAVRTAAERQRASRWADQMIFEGFRP
jgi:glycerophosphoryl diester phosphodiesterase